MEKTKKKKNKWIIILILIILLLLLFILFLLFGINRSFTVTFDTAGGTEISNIEVKNGEIISLPTNPTKEGYTFVGWTNQDGNVVTNGTKVTDDLTLKAEWIKNGAKKTTVKFDTDGGNEVNNIIIEKGKVVLLPVNPVKEGYTFVGWANEKGNIITNDMVVNSDITLKAIWISNDAKKVTIKFDTDGGNAIGSIIIENGKIILLPINPTKEGYAFAGWVDAEGNAITKDTIVSKNMVVKATWKQAYTCPSGCTPIGDGSKCTREVTKDMTTKGTCPSGYTLKNGLCLDLNNQYHAEYAEKSDGTYEWKCNSSSEYIYEAIDGMGVEVLCAKKTSKISTTGCPSGYTQSGNVCKKKETVKCTPN